MNKKIVVLILSFMASNLVAARSDCFRPYRAEITNKSGGVAIVQKTNGLSGVSRRAEFDTNSSITVMVKKRGAELKVIAGPEDNKSTRDVEFYSKEPNVFVAQVTLNPKGVTTNGFYTKNIVYSVKLVNESGALVKLTDVCGIKGAERTLADGKSITLSVQPGGYIEVLSGPENRKVSYRINFADQTGDNPTITFVKRGFMSSGIQHKNLEIYAQRIAVPRWFGKTQKRIVESFKKYPRKTKYRNARLNGYKMTEQNGAGKNGGMPEPLAAQKR